MSDGDGLRGPGEQVDISATGWGDDPPVAETRRLFVTLAKAFRAFQLYDENNPVRRRFLDALAGDFRALWKVSDHIVLSVDEDHLYLEGEVVYSSETRGDSLAFLFFKDGLREITFRQGIEGEELERFLGVMQRARKLVPEGDDLLTVLWEADLRYFTYQYVDLIAEGVALPESGEGAGQAELQALLEAEDPDLSDDGRADEGEGGAEAQAPQTVKQDDFNPTLYALDAREMERLRSEVRKELARDTRNDVLSALFDRLEEPSDRRRQSEILGIVETLLPNFLSRGAIGPATRVMDELARLERQEGALDAEGMERSRRILDDVSSPETIDQLIKALYDGTIRATPSQLGAFLAYLRGGALAPLVRASQSVEHRELRAVLRTAIQGIAQRYRRSALQLLHDEDTVVVAGAARLIGEMQLSEAGPVLAGLLGHPEGSVRLAAVEAATALRASTAAGALESVLGDDERDVRVAAARALGTLRYRPAAKALGSIVGGRRIRNADIGEKVAMFEAFGVVAGEDGVEVLGGLLNSKGFLRKREPSEVRAAAALGLGRIGSPLARAELERALGDEDPVVRSNVNRALRGEENG